MPASRHSPPSKQEADLRKGTHPALLLLLFAGALAGLLFGVHRYRHRFIHRDSDLVRWLPEGEATTFFADVAALRQGGYISLFAGNRAQADPDYRQFVGQTGFDYSEDLDAVAGSVTAERLALVARGSFDWTRLRSYASSHGGICGREGCTLPGTRPNRWVSFAELQPDVIVVDVDTRRDAAFNTIRAGAHAAQFPSSRPLWLHPAPSLLKNPANLPLPLRIFAISLQSTDSLILAVAPAASTDAAFNIELDARCENKVVADTTRGQLQTDTRMLSTELARQHIPVSNADLSGLLTSGVFFIEGKNVKGTWPVHKQLIDALR